MKPLRSQLPRTVIIGNAIIALLVLGAVFGLIANGGSGLFVDTLRGLGSTALVALTSTLLAVFFGVTWGVTTGFLPKRLGLASMRLIDVLAAAPHTLIIIIVVVVWRAAVDDNRDGRGVLILALACVQWLTLARVTVARVSALRRRPFIETALVLGMPRMRVLTVHVLPHMAGPLFTYAVLALPGALTAEAFFSFLGFGARAPHASLGSLIADGARAMSVAPVAFLLPAGVLVAATVTLQVVGGHMRDSLRPERTRPS